MRHLIVNSWIKIGCKLFLFLLQLCFPKFSQVRETLLQNMFLEHFQVRETLVRHKHAVTLAHPSGCQIWHFSIGWVEQVVLLWGQKLFSHVWLSFALSIGVFVFLNGKLSHVVRSFSNRPQTSQCSRVSHCLQISHRDHFSTPIFRFIH